MEELNRRTFTKAAGASLFGMTMTGISAAAEPVNEDVSLLEVGLTFDFGDTENLDFDRRNRPVKYALDTNSKKLQVLTAPEEEKRIFETSDQVVDFQGAKGDVQKIGGTTVQMLNARPTDTESYGTYTYSESGYEVPELNIDWTATSPDKLLQSSAIESISPNGEFFDLALPTTEIEVATKVVHDERVSHDDITEWRRGKKIEFSTKMVEVDPTLTVAFHRGLDVVAE